MTNPTIHIIYGMHIDEEHQESLVNGIIGAMGSDILEHIEQGRKGQYDPENPTEFISFPFDEVLLPYIVREYPLLGLGAIYPDGYDDGIEGYVVYLKRTADWIEHTAPVAITEPTEEETEQLLAMQKRFAPDSTIGHYHWASKTY